MFNCPHERNDAGMLGSTLFGIMNLHTILTATDSRISAYKNLRERTLRGESIFIAEGELLVKRLASSEYDVESILVAERFLPRIENVLSPEIPVYVVNETLIGEIAGYPFYQGILAVGRRRPLPNLYECTKLLGEGGDEKKVGQGRVGKILVVLPHVTKPDNLGLIFRSSAALAATAVILGEQCCDPFSRRALRVSMGGVLQVPIIRSDNLFDDLEILRDCFGFERWGTVLDTAAESLPTVTSEKNGVRKIALIFGNEYSGLEEPWVSRCDRKVVIPMSPEVDSLNLGVAVGIFLYELSNHR